MKYYISSDIPTFSDMDAAESKLSLEEIRELDRKVKHYTNYHLFKDFKDRLLAERFLKFGLLLSMVEWETVSMDQIIKIYEEGKQ